MDTEPITLSMEMGLSNTHSCTHQVMLRLFTIQMKKHFQSNFKWQVDLQSIKHIRTLSAELSLPSKAMVQAHGLKLGTLWRMLSSATLQILSTTNLSKTILISSMLAKFILAQPFKNWELSGTLAQTGSSSRLTTVTTVMTLSLTADSLILLKQL